MIKKIKFIKIITEKKNRKTLATEAALVAPLKMLNTLIFVLTLFLRYGQRVGAATLLGVDYRSARGPDCRDPSRLGRDRKVLLLFFLQNFLKTISHCSQCSS